MFGSLIWKSENRLTTHAENKYLDTAVAEVIILSPADHNGIDLAEAIAREFFLLTLIVDEKVVDTVNEVAIV